MAENQGIGEMIRALQRHPGRARIALLVQREDGNDPFAGRVGVLFTEDVSDAVRFEREGVGEVAPPIVGKPSPTWIVQPIVSGDGLFVRRPAPDADPPVAVADGQPS